MKKLVSLFWAFTMLVALIPTATAAADIKIGDYLTMGKYYGESILWRCVDIDENVPLMLSDKILCIKAFDASGNMELRQSARCRSFAKRLQCI